MNTYQQLEQHLKKAKKSVTKQRLLVFEALHLHSELSMNELHKVTEKSIDRASLYRITDLFEHIGIIHRIQMGWKYKLELSDIFRPHHHHARCQACGRLVDLPEQEALENAIKDAAKKVGFELLQHQIELSGLCIHCRSHMVDA